MTPSEDQPIIHSIKELKLPTYQTLRLANGMPVYFISGGSEPVMRIEVVFRSGGSHDIKPGIAEFMAGLLSEGTQKMTSIELAEHIESRGATIQTRGGVDTIRVRLFTLTRFLPELLDVITDVIRIPAFDPNELKLYAENKVERLQIDLKKNEVIAYRHLTEAIFGPGHPYGHNARPDDYLAITTDDLRNHHSHHIHPDRGMVFISGSFGQTEIDIIQNTLGLWTPAHANGTAKQGAHEIKNKTGLIQIPGPQAHQAAIRIGRKLFPQSHPDFNGLFLLNTILGGYFGSRLMTEIRENQGMTYGIYSSVDSFAEDGCFYISTETATDNVEKVILAIKGETDKLRTELIPEAELNMARNYLMGHLMTQLDGSFASIDYIKTMKIEGLEDGQFETLISTIQNCSPEKLRELANEYLDLDKCVTVVVK
ncbi:MAG: insulinase family protein [Saprospiraceae bacterium]|uniref:Insulinase family protein n=1 Tax=Candidatus Opimibacter skivensis TaxID=2982028 RepID=A0A9D7SV84_9BACT|nr:insulinase family protein [Candidatus Opimibacter skivensis]